MDGQNIEIQLEELKSKLESSGKKPQKTNLP
jgi:hypothetical protein